MDGSKTNTVSNLDALKLLFEIIEMTPITTVIPLIYLSLS